MAPEWGDTSDLAAWEQAAVMLIASMHMMAQCGSGALKPCPDQQMIREYEPMSGRLLLPSIHT